MTLEPCTARQFDVDTIRYAVQPGWRYRIVHGVRCEGYVNDRLVLLMRNRRGRVEHYRAPVVLGPPTVCSETYR